MKTYVCGQCSRAKAFNESDVGCLVEMADEQYNRGNQETARGTYQRAIAILEYLELGCPNCIASVKRSRDSC
jgi:hypothetical protein